HNAATATTSRSTATTSGSIENRPDGPCGRRALGLWPGLRSRVALSATSLSSAIAGARHDVLTNPERIGPGFIHSACSIPADAGTGGRPDLTRLDHGCAKLVSCPRA